MLAYRIQQAVITELSISRFITDTEIGPLYTTIESVQTDSMVKTKVERQQRLAALKTCLMRAHTSDRSSGGQYLAGVLSALRNSSNEMTEKLLMMIDRNGRTKD